MTPQIPPQHFEDRLLEQLKQVVAQNPDRADGPARGRRKTARRGPGLLPSRWSLPAWRVVLAAIPVVLAAAGFVVVTSLSGPQPGIAQAAVISRAAAALEQPNTILYLQVQNYSAHTRIICIRFGQCIGEPGDQDTGISANPADDTVTYTSQQWISHDGNQEHTIYSNGTETVDNQDTYEYAAYDPTDNTLTTVTNFGLRNPHPPSSTRSPLPSPADFESPTYYESLYREAQAGTQNVQLVGQTTIEGQPVYELRFDITPTPPAHPPAGDMCGSTVCMPPGLEILVYLDTQSYTPVRSVQLTVNTNNLPGIPEGATVTDVENFSAQTLPDTAANEHLLQMSSHPGATQIQQTEAEADAEQSQAILGAQINANVAKARGESATAQSASSKRHRASKHP